jgi:single-stranded-DNA-specific exonuclease
MRTWNELETVEVPPALQAAIGGHPLVSQTLVRRGFGDLGRARAFLEPAFYTPASPFELPDLEIAAARLERAMRDDEKICVWGDFDVDGQTSTTLLVSALRALGARVDFHIPVRHDESHGINLPWLEKVIDAGAELILTCDTGIDAYAAVAYARERGAEMLISDHHDLPPSLPSACAVVNPKRLSPGHPLATLPGVGVAFKLAEGLFSRYGEPEAVDQFLDLVALGVVADVAEQHGDVRYLLQRGLGALRNTSRLGLLKLMEQAGVKPETLTEEQVGFLLAPHVIALQLEGLNEQRKLLTSQVFQAAQSQIEKDPSLLQTPVLVLAHPAWPAGVLGIVASRLVEHYGKPAILISAPPGEAARGSARSVEGINITAAIAEQKDMLAGFGGHPMAAGLALAPGEDVMERIIQLRRGIAKSVQGMLGERGLPQASLDIDGRLPLSELNLELADDLERLAPFGAGNPLLTLVAPGLRLENHTPLGKNDEHLSLEVVDTEDNHYRALWWNGAGWPLPQGSFDLAYHLRATTFRGERQLQIEWVEAHDTEVEVVKIEAKKKLEVIDLRGIAKPEERLRQLVAEQPEMQVWAEVKQPADIPSHNRLDLSPAHALAIWSTPPGNAELQAVIEKVRPGAIYMFIIDPPTVSLPDFSKRLAGLVKHSLKADGGQTQLSRLAAATAQQGNTVVAGLEWLQARGDIRILRWEGDQVWLGRGTGQPQGDLKAIQARLNDALEESAAYRRNFKKAEKDQLVF